MFDRCTAMLDALPAIISYVDRDLRYRYANAAHLSWTGVPHDAYIGRHLWDMVLPELRVNMEPLVQRALAGEKIDAEFALPPGFGREWVRLMTMPDIEPDGTVVGIVFMATDLTRRYKLEEQLRRSEAMFHNAFHAASIGKALVDLDGRCSEVNAAFAGMLGYSREALNGVNFAVLTYPDDLDADLAQFEAVKRGEIDDYHLEKRYLRRDGGLVTAMLSVAVVRDEDRAPLFFVAQIMDVTAVRAAERDLREANARLTLALDALEGGVWQYDFASDQVDVSPGLARVLGVSSGGHAAGELAAAVHREDRRGASIEPLLDSMEDRETAFYRITRGEGETRWIRDRRQLVRDEAGRPQQVIGIATDVTEERATETRLAREAMTDPLTGLLNRRGFDTAAAGALTARRPDAPIALLLLDLDRFKPINDGFGHAAGDHVLREVARRITGLVRASDIVARLGGDEFAVLLPSADRAAAERAAARIVAALAVPYAAGGVTVAATVSVGVALAEQEATTIAALFERADAALYTVKRNGRGRWAMAA